MTLWVRTPLIPDTTATEGNIAAIGGFIRERLADVVGRWELCAFNSACRSKYQKMDRSWAYDGYELMRQDAVDALTAAALASGAPADKVVVSGLIGKGSR